MLRTFGVVSVLATAAIVAYLWMSSAREQGPTSQAAQQAEEQASQVAAGTNLQQAALTLETWFAEHGTYAGAAPPASSGAVVVRADAAGFCVQSGAGAAAFHVAGPGGVTQPGPC